MLFNWILFQILLQNHYFCTLFLFLKWKQKLLHKDDFSSEKLSIIDISEQPVKSISELTVSDTDIIE